MGFLNQFEWSESVADAAFGLISIFLVLIAIWVIGRLWKKHGKSLVVRILLVLAAIPLFVLAFMWYGMEKHFYFEKQALVTYQKQAELCAEVPPMAREKIIRPAKNASAIWVEQGEETMVVPKAPEIRLAQEMMLLAERDNWLFNVPISAKREALPKNALKLVVRRLEPEAEIGRGIDVYPLQVSLYEGDELIAHRKDYWHRKRESCDIVLLPGPSANPHLNYAGFFSRVFNQPEAIPAPKTVDLDMEDSKQAIANLPALQVSPASEAKFAIKRLTAIVPAELPSNMRIDRASDTVWVRTPSALLEIRQPFEIVDVQMVEGNVVMITRRSLIYDPEHQFFIFDGNGKLLQQSRLALPPLAENRRYSYTGSPFKVAKEGIYFAMRSYMVTPENIPETKDKRLEVDQWFLIEQDKLLISP